jgi:hypothetical protein
MPFCLQIGIISRARISDEGGAVWRALRSLTASTQMARLAAAGVATVKSIQWFGDHAVEVIFDTSGRRARRLAYRDDEPSLTLAAGGQPWFFDGDGEQGQLL